MPHIVSITKKGQMTLPKEIRVELGLKTPDKVSIELDDKKKTLKIEKVPDIMELAGRFKAPNGKTALKSREYLESHYKRA